MKAWALVHANVVGVEAVRLDEHDRWFGGPGPRKAAARRLGAPASIGNALFNASGVRLRDPPFTPDRLFAAWE